MRRTRRPSLTNRRPLGVSPYLNVFDTLYRVVEPDLLIPGLYQGGSPTLRTLTRLGITAIINMDHTQDKLPGNWAIKSLWHPIDDGMLPDLDALHDVAAQGIAWLEAGETLLVHCAQGWNRSGLMNGLILILGGYVAYGADAVKLIRNNRQNALGNRCFRSYLANYEQDPNGLTAPAPSWVLRQQEPLPEIDDLADVGDNNDLLFPWMNDEDAAWFAD